MDGRSFVAIGIGLAAAWAAMVALLWVLRPRDVPLLELARVVPDLLRLVRGLIADRSVPLAVRAAMAGLLLWLLNPVDLVPEFIPIIGPVDDLVVAVLALRYARRRLGEAHLRARWSGTDDGWMLVRRILG